MQLSILKRLPRDPHVWFGQGLAFDEAYQILQDHDTSAAYHMPPSVHSCMRAIT